MMDEDCKNIVNRTAAGFGHDACAVMGRRIVFVGSE
jgi:hypothetical protein